MFKQSTDAVSRRYVCASENIKLIGTLDGGFGDFGHHLEREMGGLWMHPIKLLDGFWLRFCDRSIPNVDTWVTADSFSNAPYANEFVTKSGLGHTSFSIRRFQYAPEEIRGLVVEFEVRNHSTQEREIELELLVRSDLRPVWFSDEIGVWDGSRDEIQYLEALDAFHVKDCDHEWHVVFGCDKKADAVCSGDLFANQVTSGNGVSGSFVLHAVVSGAETYRLKLMVSGSCDSFEDCLGEYRRLRDEPCGLEKKRSRYERIDRRSILTTDHCRMDEVFRWIKYNTDWLIVQSQGFGRAIAAGFPEYPWWFGCDSIYAIQGVLAIGDFELCRDTLRLLLRYSEKHNGNGRIVHEITTNGACPNPGNTQETAQFVMTVWNYYEWTGDRDFLERSFSYLKKSVEWLRRQDDDHDGFPNGYGIIEIAGLNLEMVDSAVYTCEAYDCFSRICKVLRDHPLSEYYKALAKQTKNAFESAFWDEEAGLYCDAVTSYPVVRDRLEAILEKTPDEMKGEVSAYMEKVLSEKKALGTAESGWLLNRNWVISTPMEVHLAPEQHALRALENLFTDSFIGPYGMYLNAMYRNATMTISTGVMAVAQAQYGFSDRAMALLEKIFDSFSISCPGAISEMSPDGGCFVQAWTTYAVVVPIVRHFFGLQPDAMNRRIIFKPCMPEAIGHAKLERVRILDGSVSVSYRRSEGCSHFTIENRTSARICIDDAVKAEVAIR